MPSPPKPTTEFHWMRKSITAELLQAVGGVTLWWAMVDAAVTDMVRIFWHNKHPDQPIPKPFDRRIRNLRDFAAELLAAEPEELRLFRWFLQRVKAANGERDAVAHGTLGTVKQHGREYSALMVPKPSGTTNYVPMTPDKITKLAETIDALHSEATHVQSALIVALNASSQDKHHSLVDGKWTLLTWGNRNPRMPTDHPPPATFQG